MAQAERIWRLSKEGAWIVLGQVASVAGALFGVRLLTELLSPDQYGELALGMTVATMASQIILGPLGNGVARFYAPAGEKSELGGYLKAVWNMLLSANIIVVFIALLFISVTAITSNLGWVAIVAAAFLLTIVSGYNAIFNSILNAARLRSIVAVHKGIETWMRFLLAAGLLLFLGGSSATAIIGYALAVMLVITSQHFFYRKSIVKKQTTKNTETDWQSKIWSFSWPMSIFGVFTWAHLASDRWALELFSNTSDVGLYAALFQLGYAPMLLASGVAMQFLAPIYYQRSGDAADAIRNADVSRLNFNVTISTLGFTVIAFILAHALHDVIFNIFVAPEFQAVSYLLPWMLLAGGIYSAGQAVSLNLMSQLKTRAMISGKIITALVGIISNVVGAYLYGVMGVVLAGVIFSSMFFLWMALLSRDQNLRKQFV